VGSHSPRAVSWLGCLNRLKKHAKYEYERGWHRDSSVYQLHVTRSRSTRPAQWRIAVALRLPGRVEGPVLARSYFLGTVPLLWWNMWKCYREPVEFVISCFCRRHFNIIPLPYLDLPSVFSFWCRFDILDF